METETTGGVCYNDKTVTGLGDRLLVMCRTMTKYPNHKIHVNWSNAKDQPRSVYDTNMLNIENGEITSNACTYDIKAVDDYIYPFQPPDEDIETFRRMMKRFKPAPEIEEVIPKQKYTCVHVRGTDKIVDDSSKDPDKTTKSHYQEIKAKCIDYVKTHIDKTYLICSDDEKLKKEFIQECGDGIKLINIDYGNKNLDKALVDLFAMSRSDLIIQCVNYSTFSMAASLIGGIPLINFNGRDMIGGPGWNWKNVLYGTVG
jgi:hypothetical protein